MGLKAKPVTSVRKLLEQILWRYNNEYDTCVLNWGDEGNGKSSFAHNFANQVAKTVGVPLTIDNFVFNTEDAIDLAITLPDGSIIVLDESTEGAFSRDAMTGKNKNFIKFLQECRHRRHILILNGPREKRIDKGVFERMHYAFLITHRGEAKAHVVYNPDYGKKDAYPIDLFYCSFRKPKGALWKQYKDKKRDFTKLRESRRSSQSETGAGEFLSKISQVEGSLTKPRLERD